MTPLFYLIYQSALNSLKEILKKPAKLAMYLLVVFGIIGVAVASIFTKPALENQVPLFWFSGILFAYTALFVVIAVIKGTASGDNIFEMNDVNFLFVSPVSSRKVLLYGILRLTKVSFLAGFFILFQTNSLALFGIGFDGVLLILLTFMLSVVVLSIASLVIYSLTNGKRLRKWIVKVGLALCFMPLVVFLVVRLAQTGNGLLALEAAIQSPYMELIPVAGWTAAGVTHILSGAWETGLLFLGANLLAGALLIVYILLSRLDYYEDALVATETVFEKKRAAAEGNINLDSSSKTVKIKKTGVPGKGAAALFGKHLRESFRQNRFGFLTLPSCILILGALAMILLTRNLLTSMQILMWTQILLIGTGRGLKETFSHYIYLIPENSFSKILWSNMEVMIKTLAESVLIFGVGGVLIQQPPLLIAGSIAAYALFSLLLLGVNYLSMRFTGADISMGLLIVIYYLMVVLAMAPGVIAAVAVGFGLGGNMGATVGLGILSAWELLAGLGCLALARGVLHNCDMQIGKPKS